MEGRTTSTAREAVVPCMHDQRRVYWDMHERLCALRCNWAVLRVLFHQVEDDEEDVGFGNNADGEVGAIALQCSLCPYPR